jgi:hypothetical protein
MLAGLLDAGTQDKDQSSKPGIREIDAKYEACKVRLARLDKASLAASQIILRLESDRAAQNEASQMLVEKAAVVHRLETEWGEINQFLCDFGVELPQTPGPGPFKSMARAISVAMGDAKVRATVSKSSSIADRLQRGKEDIDMQTQKTRASIAEIEAFYKRLTHATQELFDAMN